MSEANKAKLAAARRLLKEHQKKRDNSCQSNVADDQSGRSHPSSCKSSTPEQDVQYGNGDSLAASSTHTPSPTNAISDVPVQHLNGNYSSATPTFTHTHDYPSNSASTFFDNLPTNPVVSSEDSLFKRSSVTPPFHNTAIITDRTDSSSTVSTKSDDDSSRRLTLLESMLAVEVGRKQELEFCLSETKQKVSYLEMEVNRLQDIVDRLSKEHVPQEEKMNVQLKTIQILVSEKSELQKELATVTEESKRNADKCMEYTVKMKVLKSEVARLQSEARDNNEARQQHNSILKKLEHSLSEANTTVDQYKKDVEMNQEEIQELKRIIHENDEKNETLKKQLEEANRQLSMAEMRIAQYGGNLNESLETSSHSFEIECEKLREEVVRMRREVAENTAQYKDYIESLNGQLLQVNNQYETCVREKDELVAHKEGLLKQLYELEKQMAKERQAGPSLSQSNLHLNEQLSAARQVVEETKVQLEEKSKGYDELVEQLASTTVKLQTTELALEQLEVPDAKLLQAAMESDRIAASRAIEQNSSLKAQLTALSTEMNHSIVKLNNEKLDLTEKLQHSEYLVKELNGKLEKYHHKEHVVYTDSVAQCPMIFQKDYCAQTDVDDLEIIVNPEHATPEAMQLLEAKLKKTMMQLANLSEEKHRLEHLVLQLQGETETICEYVTLYQNQRGRLREKAIERENQLALLAKERRELKEKLSQINHLLPQVSDVGGALPSSDYNAINGDATAKIKSILTEIETSNLVQDKLDSTPNTFHPCLLCSGKLITV